MTERLLERDGNMNKKELIERIEGLKNIFGNKCEYVKIDFVIELASELDELEAGRADEAPRYVKNILARLRELPLHDREVWLKTIMGEFERDFSRAKWREGYEQGKLEGTLEREKVTVPQYVADWYEEHKDNLEYNIWDWMKYNLEPKKRENVIFSRWLGKTVNNPVETLIKMKLYGYEVKKEKRYTVVMKGTKQPLYYNASDDKLFFSMGKIASHFTRQQLEKLNFGWVFDSPGFQIEEVTE